MSLTRSAKLSMALSAGDVRAVVAEALVETLSFRRWRPMRELMLLALLGGEEVAVVVEAMEEAAEGLRDGMRRGGGGGGAPVFPKDEVEEAESDRERSVAAPLEGVEGLLSLAAAAMARSRIESSSRRLL